MRLLVDENFPRLVVQRLRDGGHDVIWAATELSGWTDPQLMEFAEEQSRLLFTLDKDFGQMAAQRREPLPESGVVLFRIHPAHAENLWPYFQSVVAAPREWCGYLSIVTDEGVVMVSLRHG
jgi:predicted nuclease of predicted toxin-antitoxin system